jgi:hypothetical protein
MYGANTEQSVVEDERREKERGSLRNIFNAIGTEMTFVPR